MEGKVSSGFKGRFGGLSARETGVELDDSIFTCRALSGSIRILLFRPSKQGIHGGEGIQRLKRVFSVDFL